MKKNYPGAYKNLLAQFSNLKNLIQKAELDFENIEINQIRDKLLEYNMPAKGDILINLKNTQNFIKSIQESLAIKIEDSSNFRTLNILIERFNEDLNGIIKDLRRECIKNDNVEGLIKLIDSDAVLAQGHIMLMHATSLHCPSMKVINTLLELKADPFKICEFRKTPFSIAVDDGHLVLAQKYLRHKADLLDESQTLEINKMINKLCETTLPEDFYFTLAQDLSDSSFTEALGWDSPITNTCFRYIRDNYEALGKNSDDLPYEFHS